jgi:hypothetical protein
MGMNVVIISANQETLDDLEGYLRGVGDVIRLHLAAHAPRRVRTRSKRKQVTR